MPIAARRLFTPPAVAAALFAVLLAGSSGSPATAAETPTEDQVMRALTVALRQQGDPYVYGAEGPDSFDCSGLVQFAYGRAGIEVPRVSRDQASFFHRLPTKRSMRPGDLMSFYDDGGVYHVGLWTGRWQDGRRLMLHAPHTGTDVQIAQVWTNKWFAGTLRQQ